MDKKVIPLLEKIIKWGAYIVAIISIAKFAKSTIENFSTGETTHGTDSSEVQGAPAPSKSK